MALCQESGQPGRPGIGFLTSGPCEKQGLYQTKAAIENAKLTTDNRQLNGPIHRFFRQTRIGCQF
jgi:hypothetical protein